MQDWSIFSAIVFKLSLTFLTNDKWTVTHWGRVTYISVSKLTIIGSDNGLSPGRRQANIGTNARKIVNSNLRNQLQWNLKRNSRIFIQENAFEKVVCEITPILSRPRYINSSWPSATYTRRDFHYLFPQRPRYVALILVLISPVPHIWGVTNGSLLASPPNSRRSPASLISPANH